MARFVNCNSCINSIICHDYCDAFSEAECYRQFEYKACVRIQAWFRGLKVRAYMKHLTASTVLIQKIWRGYRARVYTFELRRNLVYHIQFCYYTHQAIKIQKVWRGYISRKKYFDYSCRKKFFQVLQQRNETIRKEIEQLLNEEEACRQQQLAAAYQSQLDNYAARHHHLVSTIKQPGVYNTPKQLACNDMEMRLKKVKVQYCRKCRPYGDSSPEFKCTCPVPPCKLQGPFRNPHEVRMQREREPNRSLRATAEYDNLRSFIRQAKEQDWVERISDEMFELYSRPDLTKYERLLSSSGRVVPPSEVTGRKPRPEKWVSCKDFNVTLPPIPLFDKFNKTYSRTGEI